VCVCEKIMFVVCVCVNMIVSPLVVHIITVYISAESNAMIDPTIAIATSNSQ
jgi:hypothetical protein